MTGVVVSVANNCQYCQIHHGEALDNFWKDRERVKTLRKFDYDKADLKAVGFDDRALLDAALITSYFNFVNRLVLPLGVELEKAPGKGYKYD